jgi:hypothetical protein
MATAAAAARLLTPFRPFPARAEPSRDIHFRAMHRGSPSGEHNIAFRLDGDRLLVTTHIELAVKVLFFTAFRYMHDAEEVWQAGRLVSVKSTTNDNGTRLQVSGFAAGDGFRLLGEDGPFLASAQLLTSNTLWDYRLVRESRLIDVQHGNEVGLVAKLLGEEEVATPQGPVRANRYQIITPHYAGSLFYDGDGRWVKGLIEQQGEILEYALAT